MRLPLREVAARYIGVEDSRRVSAGVTASDSKPFSSAKQADLAQEEARILGAGGRGDMDAGVLYRDDEAQRVGVAGERARVVRVSD